MWVSVQLQWRNQITEHAMYLFSLYNNINFSGDFVDWFIHILLSSSLVRIGFERSSYLTSEEKGIVEVCAVVTEGRVNRNIILPVQAVDREAECKF